MSNSIPIRVLHLGSPTGLYGAERWILALIRHLDPARIESTVAVIKDAPTLEAPLCREAEMMGFRSRAFQAYGKVNPLAVMRLRSFLLQNDVNILHTHWYKADLIGLMATRGTNCRIIATPHGWSRQADFKVLCYEMISRCIFPFLDAVAPLSRELFDELQHAPGMDGKLHLILNGVDISEIESQKDIFEEILRWKDDRFFVIGYIGQLIPRKGIDVLLKAVSRLGSLNWRLAIVGDGEERAHLESMAEELGIADRIRFFGFRKDRLAFLKGFDAFVLPSRLEGIPRCLMEAMAAGAPVVATDIAGCRDLIHHGETGLLFPLEDDKRLAEEIVRVASDEVLRSALRDKGRSFILGNFSAESMARQYESLYDALTGPAGKTREGR
ncbi:MAG: glycosyltransferase family 4 protein [Syntrophobacteraceae bacterium]